LENIMRDKEPQFTVTDRRKFTAEGELRDGEAKASESTPPAPQAARPEAVAPAPAPTRIVAFAGCNFCR